MRASSSSHVRVARRTSLEDLFACSIIVAHGEILAPLRAGPYDASLYLLHVQQSDGNADHTTTAAECLSGLHLMFARTRYIANFRSSHHLPAPMT
jgi:hypothetical protein